MKQKDSNKFYKEKQKKLILPIFVVMNLALYLTAIATWLSIPDESTLNIALTALSVALSLILMVISIRQGIRQHSAARMRAFSASFLSVFLLFSIIGLINYLGVKHPWYRDFTKNQLNSLAPETQQIVKKIKGPLKFKVYSRKSEQATIMPLLDLYRYLKPDIEVELIDPDLHPEQVQREGVERYGTVIVEHQNRQQSFFEHNELQITRAILKVFRKEDPLFYFVSGHQEADLNSTSQQGISHLRTLLEKENYQWRPLNLATVASIPTDASGVIIWGPKSSFFPTEIKTLDEYMQQGGRLFVALDPDFSKQKSASELTKFLSKWGLNVSNDLVVDLRSYVNGSKFTVPLVSRYDQEHPITKDFKAQTFFPLSGSVTADKSLSNEYQFHSLALTNDFPASWAEKSADEIFNSNMHFSEGQDVKGPIAVMAAIAEKPQSAMAQAAAADETPTPISLHAPQARKKIVAVGNSSFVQNTYSPYEANFALFLKALSWLIDEDFVIHGNNRAENASPFLLSAPQVGLIFYFSMIFCPLILLVSAFYLYRKRQKL